MKDLIDVHKQPQNFHRQLFYRSYFEGWYYKQVTKDMKNTISFIPGVSFSKYGCKSFVQCIHLDANNEIKTYNIDYKITDFKYCDNPFNVWVSNSSFDMTGISININSRQLRANGKINFKDITSIRATLLNPNIMGFFSYIPFMQCNHGVLSMNHSLIGEININGNKIIFTGGKGYIEKDWGRSFPKKYVWIQSNHFSNPTLSLFCSIAHIPFGVTEFTGFICNLTFGNKEYRFATYNNSRLVINKTNKKQMCEEVYIVMTNSKYTLQIKAKLDKSSKLIAPNMGAMNKNIKEGLGGCVSIRLSNSKGNIILEDKSLKAGIEIVNT